MYWFIYNKLIPNAFDYNQDYDFSTINESKYEWKIIFVCGGICICVDSVFVILAVFYVKAYITKVKIQNSDKKDKPNCANGTASLYRQTAYIHNYNFAGGYHICNVCT